MEEKKQRNYHIGIIGQIAFLFVIGMIALGAVTFYTQRTRTEQQYKEQVESLARSRSIQVARSLQEYPAYQWLVQYWHEHYDELDIEYDADFYYAGTKTEEKCHLFNEHHPEIQIRYASLSEIQNLSPEDQNYTQRSPTLG